MLDLWGAAIREALVVIGVSWLCLSSLSQVDACIDGLIFRKWSRPVCMRCGEETMAITCSKAGLRKPEVVLEPTTKKCHATATPESFRSSTSPPTRNVDSLSVSGGRGSPSRPTIDVGNTVLAGVGAVFTLFAAIVIAVTLLFPT